MILSTTKRISTIFVDASAIVAMMTNEPEAAGLIELLLADDQRLTSAIAVWESSRAVARKRKISITAAAEAVGQFADDFAVRFVTIAAPEAAVAIDAHRRYGKGSGHPAQLNMGDCFAYACAQTNDARLLYKGDDFRKTDRP